MAKLTHKALAEALGISRFQLKRDLERGMPLDLDDAKAWRAKHLDATHTNAQKFEGITEARLRKLALETEAAELEIAQKKRELIDRSDAEVAVFALAKNFREGLETLPYRIAPLIAAKIGCDAGALMTALEDEIRRHLEDIAETEIAL